jgi:hypothetical protein
MEMSSELEIPATASDLPEISREELRSRLRDASLRVVDVLPRLRAAGQHAAIAE